MVSMSSSTPGPSPKSESETFRQHAASREPPQPKGAAAKAPGPTVVSLADEPVDFLVRDKGLLGEADDDMELEEEEDYQQLLDAAPGEEDEEESEEEEDTPPPVPSFVAKKSSRGSKAASGTPARAVAPSTAKARRSARSAAAPSAAASSTGRKRKAAEVAADEPPVARKRGRPVRTASSPATKPVQAAASQTKRGPGRPKKDDTAVVKNEPAKKGRKPRANGTAAEEQGEVWEVEAIVDDMIDDNYEHVYFVKWKGYPTSENTWEPKTNLAGCPQLVADYYEAAKKKNETKSRGRKRKNKSS